MPWLCRCDVGPGAVWSPFRVEEADMRISTAAESDVEVRSWQDFANCLGVDPDLFFPERGASTREAKEVCRGCVVREECLEYALANGEKFGIWGGMSERERRRIRRQRALARRAAAGATA
jgi:WhiB family redox-sensing transcriptional regulator